MKSVRKPIRLSLRADHHMTRRVSFVRPDDPLESAWRAMTALHLHHVPVLDGGRLVGILSDRDILLHLGRKRKRRIVSSTRVASVMTTPVVTCRRETSVAQAAGLMLQHHVHALPVVDGENRLVGIVTSADLLEIVQAMEIPGLEATLPVRFEIPCPLAPMFE